MKNHVQRVEQCSDKFKMLMTNPGFKPPIDVSTKRPSMVGDTVGFAEEMIDDDALDLCEYEDELNKGDQHEIQSEMDDDAGDYDRSNNEGWFYSDRDPE